MVSNTELSESFFALTETQRVTFTLLFVWQCDITAFFEEFTEFLSSETVLSKQCSARFPIETVSNIADVCRISFWGVF